MRRLISFIVAIIILFIEVQANVDPSQLFKQANNEYVNKNYDKSIELYEQIIKQGYINSNIYYNLGNAYYRKQEIGRSILYYRKAQKLSPNDESIQLNIKIANLKTIDKIKQVPQFFLYSFLENTYKSILPEKAAIISLVFWFLTIAFIATLIVVRKPLFKKLSFSLIIISFFISAFYFYIAVESNIYRKTENEGVIIAPSVYVKSSPDTNALDAFILHEGTTFAIVDKLNNWVKIKIASGNIGWVDNSVIGKY